MTKKVLMWAAALTLLGPMTAQAQQDPVKIGEGAQVYAKTCARCHAARSGTERTDLEWVAIVSHMRARANMTKSQAEVVLIFLQATNLPEGGAAGEDADDADLAQGFAAPANSVMPTRLRAALLSRQPAVDARAGEAPTGGNPR